MKFLKKYLDFQLIKIIAIAYTAIALVGIFKNTYLKLTTDHYSYMRWDTLLFNIHFLDWFYMMVFMTFIAITTKMMIQRKTKWFYIVLIHLLASLLLGVFLYNMAILTGHLTGTIKSNYQGINFDLNMYVRVLDLNFTIYLALISIIYAYYYFNEKRVSEVQKLQLEKQLNMTKILKLKSHLQPHFLFNTLNSIHALMQSDVKKSQNMVVDLSDLLRELIDIRNDNMIELCEELRLLDKYLSIQKIRFSDDLQVFVKTEDSIENLLVPTMIIQPILENSIKHGYSKNHLELIISIDIFKSKDLLVYQIRNNGMLLEEPFMKLIKNGMGIKNTIERLDTLYGKNNYIFKTFNADENVITEIRFPIESAMSELL